MWSQRTIGIRAELIWIDDIASCEGGIIDRWYSQENKPARRLSCIDGIILMFARTRDDDKEMISNVSNRILFQAMYHISRLSTDMHRISWAGDERDGNKISARFRSPSMGELASIWRACAVVMMKENYVNCIIAALVRTFHDYRRQATVRR